MAKPTAAIPTQTHRQLNPSSSAMPVPAAPSTAPPLNSPWKRTRCPGRSARAAADSTFITTSTNPPAAVASVNATANHPSAGAAATLRSSALQSSSARPSATPAPHRSVERAADRVRPRPRTGCRARARGRGPRRRGPNVRLMSITATANAPAKLPKTRKAAATGRSVGRGGVSPASVVGSTATRSAGSDQAFAGKVLPGPRRRSSTLVASWVRSVAFASNSAPSMTNPASAIIWRSAAPAWPSLVR